MADPIPPVPMIAVVMIKTSSGVTATLTCLRPSSGQEVPQVLPVTGPSSRAVSYKSPARPRRETSHHRMIIKSSQAPLQPNRCRANRDPDDLVRRDAPSAPPLKSGVRVIKARDHLIVLGPPRPLVVE
jgi:hypothetical protein